MFFLYDLKKNNVFKWSRIFKKNYFTEKIINNHIIVASEAAQYKTKTKGIMSIAFDRTNQNLIIKKMPDTISPILALYAIANQSISSSSFELSASLC
jgi:hypothetical protein